MLCSKMRRCRSRNVCIRPFAIVLNYENEWFPIGTLKWLLRWWQRAKTDEFFFIIKRERHSCVIVININYNCSKNKCDTRKSELNRLQIFPHVLILLMVHFAPNAEHIHSSPIDLCTDGAWDRRCKRRMWIRCFWLQKKSTQKRRGQT